MGFALFCLLAAFTIWYISNVLTYQVARRMAIRRMANEYRARARAIARYYKSRDLGS